MMRLVAHVIEFGGTTPLDLSGTGTTIAGYIATAAGSGVAILAGKERVKNDDSASVPSQIRGDIDRHSVVGEGDLSRDKELPRSPVNDSLDDFSLWGRAGYVRKVNEAHEPQEAVPFNSPSHS